METFVPSICIDFLSFPVASLVVQVQRNLPVGAQTAKEIDKTGMLGLFYEQCAYYNIQ